ncbi:MAG: efflux RND transporter periplasmic adaptor subunit [Acidobacteriota bacterium]
MSVRTKTYGFLIFIIVFVAAAYLVTPWITGSGSTTQADSKQEGSTPKDDKETTVPVEVALARTGEISASINSTANLKAVRQVGIAARTEGVVKELLVEEGAYVDKGQLLCRLDDTQPAIQLQSARQKLAQAKLQLEKAEILQDKTDVQVANAREDYERYQKLFDESLVSQREVAQAKYRLEELEHDMRASSSSRRELVHHVDELEAEINQAELEISRTRIEAPFSGFITQRDVDLGQTVRNMDTLFSLADFSPLQADVFLSEKDASLIKAGQPTTVFSGVETDTGLHGKVARISPVVDQSTGTVKVTVELVHGDSLFKPGAFVRVEIQTDTREGSVLIPKRAIVEEDGESFVFVAHENEVTRVRVQLGYQNGGSIEILNGVAAGDSVVVAGQGGLKEGSKIRLVEAAA